MLKNVSTPSLKVTASDDRSEKLQYKTFSQDIFKLPNLRPKKRNLDVSKAQSEAVAKSDDEQLTDTEINFPSKGFNTNKRLKNYDCWDEEVKPQDWVNKYKSDPDYHGQCPVFKNNQYPLL